MSIRELNNNQALSADSRVNKIYSQFARLVNELRNRELPEDMERLVDDSVDQINHSTLTGKHLSKFIKQKQSLILKKIEKEYKIVPKNYYRGLWMVLGMTSFGLPIGLVIGLSLGNIGLLGIGLPLGMAIGLAIGSSLDKKAASEGRQLNIEIKY